MNRNLTAIVAVLLVGGAQQAYAQTVTRYKFDIPAGTRAESVEAIARAVGSVVSISDPSDASLRQRVGPIRGTFTLAAALKQALAGSDWYVAAAGNQQVRIARSGADGSDIVVTATIEPLRKEDSTLLTRSDTPLRQTPGTVVSVTQEVLKSQNTTSLYEAVRNLPGVLASPGSPFSVRSRGGETNGISFTNGLRNASNASNAPTIDVEAIEVLKGPSTILTGTAVAGGLLNYVPKEATGTSGTEINIGGGSYRYVRADADIGGTISENNRLYWRAVALSEHVERQNQGGNNPFSRVGALILGYRDNGWKIDAETQYYDTRTAYGRPYRNDPETRSVQPVDLVYDRDTFYRDRSLSQNLRVEKDLASSEKFTLRLRLRARYQYNHQTYSVNSNAGTYDLGKSGEQIGFSQAASNNRSHQFSSSADLYAKLTTGKLQQQVIVAFDQTRERSRTLDDSNFVFVPLDPAPSTLPVPQGPTEDVAYNFSHLNEYGAVVQDQLTWGRLHAIASVRVSWYDAITFPDPFSKERLTKILPSAGVVYDLTDWLSGYYSYQKGLTPPQPNIRQFGGTPLPPSIRTGHEAGVKADLFDSRLSVTADYFRARSSNLALPDPLHPTFYIGQPGAGFEGAELAATGKLARSLFVQGGLTYTHATDNDPIYGTPKYTANLWLLKSFDLRDRSEIEIGLGGNYASPTPLLAFDFGTGKASNPYMYRNYLRFDASVGYRTGPIKLNLSVNNIFDRFNIDNSQIAESLSRATGRDVRLVLTFDMPKD